MEKSVGILPSSIAMACSYCARSRPTLTADASRGLQRGLGFGHGDVIADAGVVLRLVVVQRSSDRPPRSRSRICCSMSWPRISKKYSARLDCSVSFSTARSAALTCAAYCASCTSLRILPQKSGVHETSIGRFHRVEGSCRSLACEETLLIGRSSSTGSTRDWR